MRHANRSPFALFASPLFLLAVIAVLLAGCMPGSPGEGGREVVHADPTPNDLLTFGERVEIRAEVDGDVIAAGSDVVVAAPIAGYVIAAARHVSVRERVGNDLIAAGETVDVMASVEDRAIAAGRNVRVHPGVEIGSAYLTGNTVSIDGDVRDFLRAGGREVRIAGNVGGNVDVAAARVSVLPGAVIEGNLVVESPEPPEVSPQADVRGSVDHRMPDRGTGGLGWAAGWLFYTVGLLALGLVTVALMPAWAEQVGAKLAARPGASIGVGVLALIVAPIVAAMLLVTVIGIPLGVLLTALYVAALLLAAVLVAYRLGAWLLDLLGRRDASPFLRIIIGAIVLALAMSLPWIGGLVALVAVALGLGALLLERRDARRAAGAGSLGTAT